jgi:hypothetical protein
VGKINWISGSSMKAASVSAPGVDCSDGENLVICHP